MFDFQNLVSGFGFNKRFLVVKFSERAHKFLFVILNCSKKDVLIEFFWEKELRDQENPREVLPSLIELVVKKAGEGFSKIIWLVPEQYVILRRLTLPKISVKDLSSAVVWNVKKVLPCKLEDLHFSYKVLDRGKKIDILFYGVLKNYVSDFVPSSIWAKLILWPQDLAIREVLQKARPDIEKTDIFCIVYEEEGITTMILADKRANLLFKRVSSNINISSELMLMMEYYKKTSHGVPESMPVYSLKQLSQENIIYVSPEELLSLLEVGEGIASPITFLLGYGAYLGLLSNKFPGVILKKNRLSQEVKKEFDDNPQLGINQIFAFFEGIPTLPLVVVCSVIIAFFGLSYFFPWQKYKSLEREYAKLAATLSRDVFSNPGAISLQEIDEKKRKFEGEISILTSYVMNRREISKILHVLKKRFMHGFWLKLPFSINFDISKGTVNLTLTGGVYLGNEEEEMKALDELISSLRSDLKVFFNNIELLYFRREKIGDKEYLAFSLRCM